MKNAKLLLVSALTSLAVVPANLSAQDTFSEFDAERLVELRSLNGQTQLIGELSRVEDGFFIVRTELGELSISIDTVTCAGEGCPAKATGGGFAIHVGQDIGVAVLGELLRDYATFSGSELEVLDAADAGQRSVRLVDPATGDSTDIIYFSGESGFKALLETNAQISLQSTSISDEVGSIVSGPAFDQLVSAQNQSLFAQDATVVAINSDNPVRNLSRSEIGMVFSGEISNWLELGGGNLPISVYGLDDNHVISASFADYFLDGTRPVVQTATLLNLDADVKSAVQNNPGAIGFLSRAKASNVKPVAIRENCGLLTAPNGFTVKTDAYPLTHSVYAYRSPQALDPKAEALFEWMAGPMAQPSARRVGFVDNGVERINLEDMGTMLIHSAAVETDFSLVQYSGMLRDLRDAARLSLSFRFEVGSSILDQVSETELATLGARINAGEFEGLELLIAGFADSTGPSALNTEIAAERARTVRDILVDTIDPAVTSRLRMLPVSYGELLPLACNDDDEGRAKNRRVEIWARTPGIREN